MITEVAVGKVYRGPGPTCESDVKAIAFGSTAAKTLLSLEAANADWSIFQPLNPPNVEAFWALKNNLTPINLETWGVLPPSPKEVDAALIVMTDVNRYPVYVHCQHGVDRTGFICAAYRVKVQGWTYEAAEAEWMKLGFHNWCFFWWKPFLKRYLGVK
jgi:hypothetical protein